MRKKYKSLDLVTRELIGNKYKGINQRDRQYGDFIIERCFRSAIRPITRYRVWYGDLSLGLFDSVYQAERYIENLYR
ncbi:hypothetical protein [Yersinia pekkanenii]|uniref:Phage-like protein n=1 Tax=Yersinia pekkanenii TaxID=1288385 RepID=A0A0T9R678_9GAMM|nr:hypothetical protein [Yersinia pekkanenii]CNI46671.1 phage-like protein [Yersinia pekkanenii]CRY65752.1 phage-like protein [Yersinia pekkanenii]